MNFFDAVRLQPLWVQIWLDWLVFALLVLPSTLVIWPSTRKSMMVILGAHVPTIVAVACLYSKLGYVRLLGLPHVVFWTPVVIFLFAQLRRDNLPKWPRLVMTVILATFIGTLAFDYIDSLRYILGDSAQLNLPSST